MERCVKECSKVWTISAKAARKAGHYQISYGSLLKAELLGSPDFYIQKAKLYWDQGCHNVAIKYLDSYQKKLLQSVNKDRKATHILAKVTAPFTSLSCCSPLY
jgi:hypothetical protein